MTITMTGREKPDILLSRLNTLDWESFHPHTHGEQLRDLLLIHQEMYGANQSHTFCSEKLRHHLKLLHPYAHENTIDFHHISPDKKWLATGSWVGEDYDRGGVLQIWEVKTGRVVNRLRIYGGVGWPDNKGIEWSPDSREVALAFDTNGVGVWDPFDSSNGPRVYAYVTDGWDSSPYFAWHPGGEKIFIQCNIDWDETTGEEYDEEKGCWIYVKGRQGDVSGSAEPGYWEVGEQGKPEDKHINHNISILPGESAYYGVNNSLVIIGADYVKFYFLNTGKSYGEFYDRNPGMEHSLYINYVDKGDELNIHPAFGVYLRGKEYWGMAFEEGSIVVPADYKAEDYLNFSLGNKWTWPLSWGSYTRAETLAALCNNEKAQLPDVIRSLFKKRKTVKVRVKKSVPWPAEKNKGYGDILNCAIDAVKGLLNRGHTVDDYVQEIAFTEVLRNNPENALKILELISENHKAPAAAEMAFHCLKRNLKAEQFLEITGKALQGTPGYKKCAVYSLLTIVHYLLGNTKKMEECEILAEKYRLPENNQGENSWPFINMLFMTRRSSTAYKLMKEWDIRSSPFYWVDVWYNLIWYSSMEEMLSFRRFCLENQIAKIYDMYEYFTEKIIHDKSYNLLMETCSHITTYRDVVIDAVLQTMVYEGIDISGYLKDLLAGKPGKYWLHRLLLAGHHYPEIAGQVIRERKWTLRDAVSWASYEDGKYDVFHALGEIISLLQMQSSFKEEVQALNNPYRAACFTGLASFLSPGAGTQLLNDAVSLIPTPCDYNGVYLWLNVVKGAFKCNSPAYHGFLKQAQEVAIGRNKDLDLEKIVDVLAGLGDMPAAFRTWMKIPKGSRNSRMYGFFQKLCKPASSLYNHTSAKPAPLPYYAELYDLLMRLPADDINDRAQTAVRVLSTLTRSRGIKY